MDTHNGPRVCSVCNHKLRQPAALACHEQMHTKPSLRREPPVSHRCRRCWRNLFSTSSARRHERTCKREFSAPPPESSIAQRKEADARAAKFGTHWDLLQLTRARRDECTYGEHGEYFFCALCACDHWK